MNSIRQEQKRRSRVKNDITTMQMSNGIKSRVKRVKKYCDLDKLDEALDELLSFYEDNHPDIRVLKMDKAVE